MPRPDDPRDSSIAALAREYLHRTKQGWRQKLGKRSEERQTVFDGEPTHLTLREDPTKAALLGLLLPGGGFLYVKSPFLASAALMGLLLTGTLFGSLSGILPSWISEPLLRDLQWDFSLGSSLMVTGFFFSVIWWASIVWPVYSVRARIPKTYRPTENIFKLLGGSLLPMIGQFSQGKFWTGYIVGLFYFWVPLSVASTLKIWTDAATSPITGVAKMEPYFIGSIVLFFVSFLVVVVALWHAVTGAFRELGWLGSGRDFGTEWKFVVLGSLVIVMMTFFAFVGRPGDQARQWLWDSSLTIEARGLSRSALFLRRTSQKWERAVLPLKDFLTLVD